jgi:dihydroceramidase
MSVGTRTPYWGFPDANIDWCEQNYSTSPYFAEFWNSLSSIPISMFGILGYILAYRTAWREAR